MKFKYLHCVPTYNNPKTIATVVQDLLRESPHDILVMDDGSDIPAEKIIHETLHLNPEQRARLHCVRIDENLGKGHGLQAAFRWALEHNYTHVVTSDGDAQHPASEVLKVYQASVRHPWALIVGNRNMNTPNVPSISQFGRKFSNFWVKYQTNTRVSDSQSGLRCYPLIHLQNTRFFTKRFDFEIEVLIRLIWQGIEVVEEPVAVIYQKGDERVSHFNKLWDNVRITALNTLFIILSLFKEQSSPIKLAAGFGVGIFIGCTPFYGLHMLISAAASFFLKLNFVALIAGNQISLPPLLPVLVPASIAIGKRVMGHGGAWSFFVGTSILGAGLGVIGFISLWAFLSSRKRTVRKNAESPNWRGEQRGGKLGNYFLKQLMRFAGLKACYICVIIFVIPYFYLFSKKARKASTQYWRTLNPRLSFWARQWKVLQHMYRYSSILLDSIYISMLGSDAFELRSSGYETLKSALDRKKGILMFTAHCGAWSLSARALGRHKFSNAIHIVRYEGEGLTLAKLQDKAMAPQEIIVNQQSLPVLEIRKALQAGGVVSMMGDRPIGNRLQLLKFMGKWITLDLSPFRTAIACDSAIFYGFGFRENNGGYVFEVGEIARPVDCPDKDEAASRIAQEYLRSLEKYVQLYPEQWFNWYDYFSFDKKLFSNSLLSTIHSAVVPDTPITKTPDTSSV